MITKEYLNPEEGMSIEKHATCLRDELLIRILRRTGCRISECLGIEVQHINFENETITIEHQKSKVKITCPECSGKLGKNSKFCQKCGVQVSKAIVSAQETKRMRKVPIDQGTLKLIREYIDRGGTYSINNKYFLFNITRQWARKIVCECAKDAGLSKLINPETGKIHHVSPHKFRDSFAIHAVKQDDSGDGIRLLQELLGHQRYDTTMKYRKVAGDEAKKFYDKTFKDTE